jgi:hypothetical protein
VRNAIWRIIHNDEKLHNLYCPPNIIVVIKSRGEGVRWARHVVLMAENINIYKQLSSEKPKVTTWETKVKG